MFGFFESNEQKADKACAKGCMAMLHGDNASAIEYFKKAVWLNPNHYEAWNNYGVVLGLHTIALHEAKKCFEKAISLKPDYEKSIRGLGLIEKNLGNDDRAIELFRRLEQEFGYRPEKDLSLTDEEFNWLLDHDL